METRVIRIYQVIADVIQQACSYDTVKMLFHHDPYVLTTQDNNYTRVVVGSKNIIGVCGDTARIDADRISAKMRTVLADQDLLVRYRNKNPIPYPLKIRVIDLTGSSYPSLTLSQTEAHTSIRATIEDFAAELQSALEDQEDKIQRKTEAKIKMLKNPTPEDLEPDMNDVLDLQDIQDDINAFDKFCAQYQLDKSTEIKIIKPSGSAYRITYYDAHAGRRVQQSVCDVVIVAGNAMPVLQDAQQRKRRSDRKSQAYYSNTLKEGINFIN